MICRNICVNSKRSLITDIIRRNKKERHGIETREVNPAAYNRIVLGKRVISITWRLSYIRVFSTFTVSLSSNKPLEN
jgi:hypothetical protein